MSDFVNTIDIFACVYLDRFMNILKLGKLVSAFLGVEVCLEHGMLHFITD